MSSFYLLLSTHPGWSLLARFVCGGVSVHLSHMQSLNICNTFFLDSGVNKQTFPFLTDNRGLVAAVQDFWRKWFYETPGFLTNTLAGLQSLKLNLQDVCGKKILTFILALHLL